MEFDAVLLPPRRARMVAQGHWHDRTINDALDACVAACPDKLALTALQVETGATTRFTYRELASMADRIAVGLSRLGVGQGDIVACQLPNWWQFTLTYLACSRIGAVMNPLMHIFRERELSFMLQHGEAKVVIAPKIFRGFDFEQMITALQPSLPHTAEAGMAKWWGPKLSYDVIHQCLLCFGHGGYDRGLMEQRLRDVLGFQIGDGTAQIMKTIIARARAGRKFVPA